MTFAAITKSPARDRVSPNLVNYGETCRRFAWDDARRLLAGLPGGGLNIAFEATDRHVAEGRGNRLALRWLDRDGTKRDYSYADLARESTRFAAMLHRLGIDRGDVVFALLGRVPALYIAALGTMKAGAVFSPLFSAFGPSPVQQRMTIGTAAWVRQDLGTRISLSFLGGISFSRVRTESHLRVTDRRLAIWAPFIQQYTTIDHHVGPVAGAEAHIRVADHAALTAGVRLHGAGGSGGWMIRPGVGIRWLF